MSLDWATLRGIAAMKDDIGVLSIYLHRDPQARADVAAKPPWEVRLRQQLQQLREDLKAEGPRERWKAVTEKLDALAPELDRLLDPTRSGQGLAMFAPVSDGEIETVAVQVPLPDRVVFEPGAYLRPLLTAWSAAGPAGVVSVSADELRFIDLRVGSAEAVGSIPCLYEGEQRRELHGPAGGNPSHMQQGVNQTDLYHRREEEKLHRFLHSVGPQLAEHVTGREWQFLILTGEAPLVQAVRDGLPSQLPAEVLTMDHAVHTLTPPKIAATVEPVLAEARQRRHLALANRTKEHALSANAGACGLGETLAALQEGRVAQLLLSADGQWRGSSNRDGYLVPEGEVPPGSDGSDLRAEPRLGERMIELALATSAEVTVLDQAAAVPFADCGGVGALLRW